MKIKIKEVSLQGKEFEEMMTQYIERAHTVDGKLVVTLDKVVIDFSIDKPTNATHIERFEQILKQMKDEKTALERELAFRDESNKVATLAPITYPGEVHADNQRAIDKIVNDKITK